MYSSEPDSVEYPYAGWIPTANGHLSFRHVGEAQHPSETIYANITTHEHRIILGYQRRPLSDVLFQWIIHYLCNIEGTFWFVFAARSVGAPGDIEELLGQIFIYKSRDDWRLNGEKQTRTAIHQINEVRLSLNPSRDAYIEENFRSALIALDGTADVVLRFVMNRSGEVYFSKPTFNDPDLEYASLDYAMANGRDFQKWIADQAYFFVRDISHTHQHHPPSVDTILILQERQRFDEIGWRRNIIYSLHHYIIRSKRFGDRKSTYRAMGVLGYCMSFYAICRRRLGKKAREIPAYNDAALIRSLEARAKEEIANSEEVDQKNSARNSGIQNIFIVIAIVIAILAMFVQPVVSTNKYPRIDAISSYMAQNLPEIISILFILGAFAWSGASWKPRTTIAKDILEVTNVYRKFWSRLLILMSTAVMLITIGVAWPAVMDLAEIFSGLIKVALKL